MAKNNEIHRLDDTFRTERKSYKPIFIISSVLLILVILGLIIFKDSFKLNSIDTFDESTDLLYDKKLQPTFKNIIVNSDFSNIYIEENNENYIGVTIYGENAKEKVYTDGEDLNINLRLSCTICHKVKSGRIVLSVPESLINKITLNVEYGSATMDDFEDMDMIANIQYGNFLAASLKSLDLKLKSGNIKISSIGSITTNVEIGNVTVNTVSEYADIYAGLGNIIITYFEPNKDSRLETNNGSVVIVSEDDIYYNAKSKNGIIKLPENNESNKNNTKVHIITETGNITVGE